jgi:hypothetical protein
MQARRAFMSFEEHASPDLIRLVQVLVGFRKNRNRSKPRREMRIADISDPPSCFPAFKISSATFGWYPARRCVALHK